MATSEVSNRHFYSTGSWAALRNRSRMAAPPPAARVERTRNCGAPLHIECAKSGVEVSRQFLGGFPAAPRVEDGGNSRDRISPNQLGGKHGGEGLAWTPGGRLGS